MPMIAPAVLDRLRTYDTPTISNIVELFEVRPRTAGYMNASIRACFPEMPPIVGFAATATVRASAPPRKGSHYDTIHTQVERFAELSGPPLVVLQDLDNPTVAAVFGDLMCTAYQAFGAVGLITNGSGRDLSQIRALNFPIFMPGICCSHGYNHMVQVGVPVTVGGVEVQPDALIHADSNGVVTIPAEIAAEVADAAYEFVAAEAVILDALRAENLSPARYAEARSESAARIERLREQLTRAPA